STLSGSYAYTDTLKGVYYGPGCLTVALPKLLTPHPPCRQIDVLHRVEAILREHGA
ncbi:hypothetical protein DFH11DRAFT_1566401, partial [Phellopilus nigrolimitatus]